MYDLIKTKMIIVNEIPKLEIVRLVRGLYIQEGKREGGTYSGEDNDPLIYIESDLKDPLNRIINIRYERIGSSEMMDYEIAILADPSNLKGNKGLQYYFKCPVSGKRAKILYYDIRTHLFVHREAYSQRLYYSIQTFTKKQRIYGQSNNIENKLMKMFLLKKKNTHKGEPIKMVRSIGKSINRKRIIDELIYQKVLSDFKK